MFSNTLELFGVRTCAIVSGTFKAFSLYIITLPYSKYFIRNATVDINVKMYPAGSKPGDELQPSVEHNEQ